jgi:hypothetical protein
MSKYPAPVAYAASLWVGGWVATRWRQDGDKTKIKREQKLDDTFWGKSFFFEENGNKKKNHKEGTTRRREKNEKKNNNQEVLALIC